MDSNSFNYFCYCCQCSISYTFHLHAQTNSIRSVSSRNKSSSPSCYHFGHLIFTTISLCTSDYWNAFILGSRGRKYLELEFRRISIGILSHSCGTNLQNYQKVCSITQTFISITNDHCFPDICLLFQPLHLFQSWKVVSNLSSLFRTILTLRNRRIRYCRFWIMSLSRSRRHYRGGIHFNSSFIYPCC